MPITEELKNIQKLESVGFDHKQAEALADIIEQAQTNGHESLKEFIRNEINGLDTKLSNDNKSLRLEIKTDIANLKADIMTSQKDMLIKLFGIIVGTVGIAVAILKAFP